MLFVHMTWDLPDNDILRLRESRKHRYAVHCQIKDKWNKLIFGWLNFIRLCEATFKPFECFVFLNVYTKCSLFCDILNYYTSFGGSVAEQLACWTQAQKDLGSNRSRDAVG